MPLFNRKKQTENIFLADSEEFDNAEQVFEYIKDVKDKKTSQYKYDYFVFWDNVFTIFSADFGYPDFAKATTKEKEKVLQKLKEEGRIH